MIDASFFYSTAKFIKNNFKLSSVMFQVFFDLTLPKFDLVTILKKIKVFKPENVRIHVVEAPIRFRYCSEFGKIINFGRTNLFKP
jgi:hypothetical protein